MAMAFLLLGLGFLLGILSLAIAEGLALLWAIRSLTRRSSASRATPPPPQLPVHPTPPRSVSRHGLNRQVRPGREGHPFIFSIGSVQFNQLMLSKASKRARLSLLQLVHSILIRVCCTYFLFGLLFAFGGPSYSQAHSSFHLISSIHCFIAAYAPHVHDLYLNY
jgi:hypothetical protein